jgi:hypothetical protein
MRKGCLIGKAFPEEMMTDFSRLDLVLQTVTMEVLILLNDKFSNLEWKNN